MTNANALAEWVSGFSLAGSAGGATQKAKDLLLDLLGVLLAGAAEEESAKIAFEYAQRLGGAGEATLLKRGAARLPAESVAFAHACAAHSIEMDDVHNASSLHPGVVSIPAALSAAEMTGASGARLLEAIIVGYEIAIRVGEAAGAAALYARGFHPTAVCGVFSSAAAAGKLMGLSADQMTNAWGLAWGFAGGSMSFQTEGSWAKRIQAGNAVRCGVQAARLAALGASGPSHVFEKHGFFQSYAGQLDEKKLLGDLGEPLKIMETGIKPFACCRYNQTPIDGLLELRRAHDLKPENIERVDIHIASTGLPLVAVPAEAKRRPQGSVEAQFSLYYSAAIALVAGDAGRREYREPWLSNARVLDLAARVNVESDGAIDLLFPRKWAARVRVRTRGGGEVVQYSEDCLGDPEKPLSEEALRGKFRSLTEGTLKTDRVGEVITMIERMECESEGGAVSRVVRDAMS